MPIQYRATGRRKRAVAKVILQPGTGNVTVNERSPEHYFGGRDLWLARVMEPLTLVGARETLDVRAVTQGGGITGHADAIRLAIARALVEINPSYKAALKAAGMLTRDPREVERKHYYRRKARKSPQYSKR